MKIFILLISIFFTFSSYAYTPSCSKKGTVVIYSNGLDSSRIMTNDNKDRLEAKNVFLNPKIDKNTTTKPEYIFQHNSRYQDSDESILNKYKDFVTTTMFLLKTRASQIYSVNLTEEKQLDFIKDATGIATGVAPQNLAQVGALAVEKFIEYLAGEAQKASTSLPEQNVKELVKLYRTNLDQDKHILAVTHGE